MTSELRSEGILTITLRNWRLIDPPLYTMVEMSHAIFRGVERHTYSLTPSIFRRFAFEHMETLDERNEYIKSCYKHFLEALRGRRGPLSKPLDAYNPFEIWSLGRHFGVKNTLLDWSHSPYICLFFAFADRREEEEISVRSLYCLKRNVIREADAASTGDQPYGSTPEEIDRILLTEEPVYKSLVFYKPLSDENFRMINQQGLFTVSRSPHTIEQWVSENYATIRGDLERKLANETSQRMCGAEHCRRKCDKLKKELDSGWVLLKVNIETTNNDRTQILKVLNRMNINYATLFPDVEGASLYANMQGDIRHY
jgi:hypothetical protein